MLHPWDLSIPEAKALQIDLRRQLIPVWDDRPVRTVAGVDVSVRGNSACAAIVVLSLPSLVLLAVARSTNAVSFPYVPGLLSFREGPAVMAAWERLNAEPDVVMFDGQGIAHPRGIGLAAHLGLWLNRPTIGVAKSRLYGRHGEPGHHKGAWAPLVDEEQPERTLGAVLRTRTGVKPLYVSPGHLIDVVHSIELVLACTTQYRLPQTTRWAHRFAGDESLTAL